MREFHKRRRRRNNKIEKRIFFEIHVRVSFSQAVLNQKRKKQEEGKFGITRRL